jgi:hypothetical protein
MLPEEGLIAKAAEGSPTIEHQFEHIHNARLELVEENAPGFSVCSASIGEIGRRDRGHIERCLHESARAVRDAVMGKISTREHMRFDYDHPMLLLQHMLWHEGYHHGQIKLALKIAGMPLSDEAVGPVTWEVWTRSDEGGLGGSGASCLHGSSGVAYASFSVRP